MKLIVFFMILAAMVEAGAFCLLVWGFMNLIGTMVRARKGGHSVASPEPGPGPATSVWLVFPGPGDDLDVSDSRPEKVGPTDPVSEVIFSEIIDSLRKGKS